MEAHNLVSLGRDLTRGEDELVVFRNGGFVYADTLCVTPNASVMTAKVPGHARRDGTGSRTFLRVLRPGS
ncbi:MAG TPA: hypothetical protein VES88_17860 [Gemmatimonadaceae bacterium]|nr:hypothetical protein [Gemmatimonadaceae bacterium]